MASKAGKLLNQAQIDQVNQSVADARAVCSAQIVPVVVSNSGRYERAEDMVGLWAAALGLALTLALLSRLPVAGATARNGEIWRMGLIPTITAVVGGFVVGAIIATQIGWLRRLFVPKGQMLQSVRNRGRQVFYEFRLADMKGSERLVLILVSLYEKAAVVLVSEDVQARLSPALLDEISRPLGQQVAAGGAAAGLCAAVIKTAQLLAGVYPPQPLSAVQPSPQPVAILE